MVQAHMELSKGPEPGSMIRMAIVLPSGRKANAFLSEEEAQTLSNRLQSLAKGQGDGSVERLFA